MSVNTSTRSHSETHSDDDHSDISVSYSLFLQQKKKEHFLTFVLLGLALIVFYAGLFIGPLDISWSDLGNPESLNHAILRDIRLPRLLMGFFVGGGLALVGAVLQALFANPLADAGLIGISAGAMVCIVIGVVLVPFIPGLPLLFQITGSFALPLLAFLGGLCLVLLVYKLSLVQGKVDIPTMLLSGVAVNALAGSVAGLIISVANDNELRTVTFWTMGSLNGMTWKGLLPVAILTALGSAYLYRKREELNCLMMGEKQAICLGIDVERLKRKALICCAFIAGASVALTGMIGFVGLVVPHVVRSLFGVRMPFVMLMSFIGGGLFLVLADIFSRNIVLPAELPIGITTSFIGAPYFIFLLMKRKRGMNA